MATNILVGDGFIGHHLTKKLRQRGDRVILIHHDQLGKTYYNPFVGEFDYLYYLAAYGNHFNQAKDEEKTFQANVLDPRKTFFRTLNTTYKGFLFVSTSSVGLFYQTLYSATKAATEKILTAYANQYQKPVVSVRPFSVYGEGEAKFRFIPTIVNTILRGQELYLDAESKHDWIHVEDLVEGMIKAAEKAKKTPGVVFDFGTGKQTSNAEIVKMVEQILEKKANIVKVKSTRPYDTQEWVRPNDTADLVLGWKPKISLEEGLARTLKYYLVEYAKTHVPQS